MLKQREDSMYIYEPLFNELKNVLQEDITNSYNFLDFVL